MKKEPLTLLLAVVADVDTRFGLLPHDPAQRLPPEIVDLGRIDGFAARSAHIEPGQFGRAGQAAGMGRQDPFLAAAHRHSFQLDSGVFPSLPRNRRGTSGAIANKSLVVGVSAPYTTPRRRNN